MTPALAGLLVAGCGADPESATPELPEPVHDEWSSPPLDTPSDEPEATEDPTDASESPEVADAAEVSPLDSQADTPEPAPAVCGDGVVAGAEACDDGNVGDGDGDWCAADCSALVDVSTYTGYAGHRSHGVLTTSNGLAVATWTERDYSDTARHVVDRFLPHPYSAYDEGTPTPDYLFDMYFGFRREGASGGWLNSVPPTGIGYAPGGTGVIQTTQQVGDLRFDSTYFVPYYGPGGAPVDARLLVAMVEVTNTGSEPIDGLGLYSLWNVHAGGEGDSDGEAVAQLDGPGRLVETRGVNRFLYQTLVTAGVSVSADNGGDPNNPWLLGNAGLPLANYVEPMAGDDIVVGFDNAVGTLPPGGVTRAGAVMGFTDTADTDALASQISAFVAGRSAPEILAEELAGWEAWHAVETPPAGASDDELAVYRQSTAVLRMGQVRETEATGCPSGRCHGQILASLVPGQWNISWVRDASYAILGLVRAGHLAEARDGLEFMLKAEMQREGGANLYQAVFVESDDPSPGTWGLGVDLSTDYAISVARYFGRGLEESDANAAGPNIEWDNWGLFLWAFAEYAVAAPPGDTLVATWWEVVATRVANLLVELIEPELGLLHADSSIWERHWCPHGECDEPDTRKHHAYSSIVAAQGLSRMAALAAARGEATSSASWSEAAETLRQGLLDHLVITPPGTGLPTLAGNLEELPFEVFYLDLSVVEAVNTGVMAPGSPEAFGTLAAFRTYLGIGPHSPGFVRTDDPTWYDAQEWVVADLRVVSAMTRMGQHNGARTLLDWITAQARANFDLIGELLSDGVYQPGSEDDRWNKGTDAGADYQGAVPMCGFGPGAWILALHDVHESSP